MQREIGTLPAGPVLPGAGPAHRVDGAHWAPLDELKQHPLSQSPALAHGVAQVFEMQGPEQHQSREQLPPGPAHSAADVSTSAGTTPAKQVFVDVQTPAASKQHRLSQSTFESHGPAQTSELQIALPQQGLSQRPPGGEHSVVAARALASVTVPLSRSVGVLPAPELARMALSRRCADVPAALGAAALGGAAGSAPASRAF